MSDSKKVGSDELLIAALVGGQTVKDAAKAAGISERTAYRRLADSGFQVALSDARRAVTAESLNLLTALTTKAAQRLGLLVESQNERVALGAIKAILLGRSKMQSDHEFDTRLAELERLVKSRLRGRRR